jgi:hypothetical protein
MTKPPRSGKEVIPLTNLSRRLWPYLRPRRKAKLLIVLAVIISLPRTNPAKPTESVTQTPALIHGAPYARIGGHIHIRAEGRWKSTGPRC